ncbi:MAG: ABC transporter ATP-binding protein [Gammaproteobacteria bacterium]|nr:ABC transporter ATP-binding protein [Gammaproteobacteria bacterium]
MNLLETKDLSKHYGKTRAIDELNLTLSAGEPIALIGPNGAGKTTFLSLLSGYIQPTRGSISVLGHSPGSRALQGELAALPQDAMLDPRFSIVRQIRFLARLQGMSRGEASVDTDRVLDLVQLRNAAHKKPSELSHGMRKRIAIAQMLLGNPKIALLDEPTAGLDPPNVRIIRDLISSNAGRTTFIVSSHNLDELEKVCRSVVFLSEGQLKGHMPIDEADDDDGYLSIRVPGVDADEFIATVSAIPGINSVTRQEQGDFVIRYEIQGYPAMDQSVLQLLQNHSWRYRHLIKGKTLEDKLFR